MRGVSGTFYGRGQLREWQARTNEDLRVLVWPRLLPNGEIDDLQRLFSQVAILRVLNQPDDFERSADFTQPAHAEHRAHRVAGLENLPGQSFIDDGHQGRTRNVVVIEIAACQEQRLQRL